MTTTKKIALVTGANKGLGKEISRQLGQQGYYVLLAARDESLGKKAADELRASGMEVAPIKLDVTNPDHIASAVHFVTTTFGRLDLLVNNAGIALEWDGSGTSVEKIRKTLEVNVIAPYALTEAFMPLLEKSADARVIHQSSMLGSIGEVEKSWPHVKNFVSPGYSMSKAALNMLSLIQGNNFGAKGVLVAAAHPGWVKTDLGSDAAPMEVGDGAKTVVNLATMPRDAFPNATLSHMGARLPW